MSIAGIEKVKEAEAAAEKIRKNSETEAAGIIAAGKKEAKAVIEGVQKEGDTEYKIKMSKAETEAQGLYQKRIDEEKKTCEEIKVEGRKNMGHAVDTIVGKVVNVYGNS